MSSIFTRQTISFEQSGVLDKLVLDYLGRKDVLNNFYGHYPDKEGFERLINSIRFDRLDREILSEVLKNQAGSVTNTSEQSFQNINKLKSGKAYTITTGHQLCLFTGPLYFVYKILSAIKLAEYLNAEFPECVFVPVYWMASEDHDFEEVNHFNLFGKTLKWETQQRGAVGNFKTSELNAINNQLKEVLGSGPHAEELLALFEKSYLQHEHLNLATRFLVNELFGAYGLVIVDGNDRELKKQFSGFFRQDLFEQKAYSEISKTINSLAKLGYEAQVNPREINCFLLEQNGRHRIEKDDGGFKLNGSDKKFTTAEMERLLETEVEKLSANVSLRPLYQQVILPNIAYVGGPGELAYWLEYKSFFDANSVVFPILVPRNFVLLIEKQVKIKVNKLGFNEVDFFKSGEELAKEFVAKTSGTFELEDEKKMINSLFAVVAEKVSSVDKTLEGSVKAELQKSLNSLDILSGKANKALKQKSETGINQVNALKQKLFPGGVPQERHENFSVFYLNYGKSLITELYLQAEPLSGGQLILIGA